MLQSRWLQIWRSLRFEFWLPLPLLAITFWIGGGFVMDRILSRSYETSRYVKAEMLSVQESKKTVLSITAKINDSQGVSRVKVKTAAKALRELEFEFPITDLNHLEEAISTELGLSVADVRKLIQLEQFSHPKQAIKSFQSKKSLQNLH